MSRIDVHAEWVSPAILRMLGDLPDEVEGGQIVRDADGIPTGVFVSQDSLSIDSVLKTAAGQRYRPDRSGPAAMDGLAARSFPQYHDE